MKIVDHIRKLKPLTAEEERELFYTDKQKLVLHYLPLALKYFYKYRYLTNDTDELLTIGYLALWKILESFNPERGVRFYMYCRKALKFQALEELPGYQNDRHDGKHALFTINVEDFEEDLEDESDLEYKVDLERLHDKVRKLKGTERAVLQGMLADRSLREIGDTIGMTGEAVRLISLKAMKKVMKGR